MEEKNSELIAQCPLNDEEFLPVEPPIELKYHFTVFFDGTNNSRFDINYRTQATEEYQALKADGKIDAGGSVENGYTNIHFLENKSLKKEGYNESVPMYITGAGTFDNEQFEDMDEARGVADYNDGFWDVSARKQHLADKASQAAGLGAGRGETGIKAKIQEAIDKLNEFIQEEIDGISDEQVVVTLDLDVFGFSRGAATARYFCYVIKNEIQRLYHKEGQGAHNVNLGFVGLYDTVASYFDRTKGQKSFDYSELDFISATKSLHLSAVRKAKYVAHLCAADEFRKNFSLTLCKSVKDGCEVFLPGCHSDVGGSYRSDVSIDNYQLFKTENAHTRDRLMHFLIQGGWFYEVDQIPDWATNTAAIDTTISIRKDVKIKESRYYPPQGVGSYAPPQVRTRYSAVCQQKIPADYAKITLDLMIDIANTSGLANFNLSGYDFSSSKVLQVAKEKLFTYSQKFYGVSMTGEQSEANDWHPGANAQPLWLKQLRLNYLHWSADVGLTNGPRIVNDTYTRQTFSG
jgi:hypothetical protein